MKITSKRFSKLTLAEYITMRLTHLPKFDRSNGWAQVIGKGEEVNRKYGEFRALLNLATEFDLDI